MGESVANRRKPKRMGKLRKEAYEKGLKTYHGRRCRNCRGTEKYTSIGQCIKCRIVRIKHRQESQISIVRELKNKPCLDCGNKYHFSAMQFDHVRGKKEFKLASARNRSTEEIISEVNKCEVVCANCHSYRTWSRAKKKKSYGKNSSKNTKRTRQSNKASS